MSVRMGLSFVALAVALSISGCAADDPTSEASLEEVRARGGVCNLLCVIGRHCAIVHHRATCVPDAPVPCNLACINGYHCDATGGTPTCVPTLCAAGSCGPALGMPNQLCSDGTTISGPTGNCLQHADGTCGWEVITCP